MEKWQEYAAIDSFYRTLFKSLETNSALRKRHTLNDWLGFGLRKDDLVLDPYIDRWEKPDRQTVSRFHWWLNEKFRPYINHGLGLGHRLLNGTELDLLKEYSANLLRNVEDMQGNGYGYVTTIEIRSAVVASAAARLFTFRGTPGVGVGEHEAAQSHWYEIGRDLSQKLKESGKDGSDEFAAAMFNLKSICEGGSQ